MSNETAIRLIMDQIEAELRRADGLHAPMNSAHEGHSVIREELDELWEHVRGDTGRTPDARKEAIQIAAMGARYALNVCDRVSTRASSKVPS